MLRELHTERDSGSAYHKEQTKCISVGCSLNYCYCTRYFVAVGVFPHKDRTESCGTGTNEVRLLGWGDKTNKLPEDHYFYNLADDYIISHRRVDRYYRLALGCAVCTLMI